MEKTRCKDPYIDAAHHGTDLDHNTPTDKTSQVLDKQFNYPYLSRFHICIIPKGRMRKAARV